jgi:hypothetical protein
VGVLHLASENSETQERFRMAQLKIFILLILKKDLSGSIRRRTLHKIWVVRKITEPDLSLKDPYVVTRDALLLCRALSSCV